MADTLSYPSVRARLNTHKELHDYLRKSLDDFAMAERDRDRADEALTQEWNNKCKECSHDAAFTPIECHWLWLAHRYPTSSIADCASEVPAMIMAASAEIEIELNEIEVGIPLLPPERMAEVLSGVLSLSQDVTELGG